jgi:hypothetical protein
MLGYLDREGEAWRIGNRFFERGLRRRVTAPSRTGGVSG